jgi:hypothetical protein
MPRIIKQALVDQDLVQIWLYTFNEGEGSKQINTWMNWMQLLSFWLTSH